MKKRVILLAACLAGLLACNCTRRAPGRDWNILLVSIESLRANNLGCYGYGRDTSPNIDAVAREGTLFENAISTTSWTLPSHMSLFTSMVPTAHGVSTEGYSLHQRIPTLAQELSRHGYATAAFCTSPYMNAAYGFDRGFDLYYNTDSEKAGYDETVSPSRASDRASHADVTSPRIAELVRGWLSAHGRGRFFLFVHMWDVHYDYIPPPPYDAMFDPGYRGKVSPEKYMDNDEINAGMDPRDLRHIVALYDGEIAYVDHHIGLILGELKRLALESRTVVIILADHGEEFFEHGEKGHRQSLYDEVTRVPLILRLPDGEGRGRVVRSQVSLIDVAPTILDIVGIRQPQQMTGESLMPLVRGTTDRHDRYALSELEQKLHALKTLRTNDWKLLYNVGEKVAVILDLKADPEETHGSLVKSPVVWKEAEGELSRRLSASADLARRYRGSEKGPPVALSDIDRERLKALGYID